MRIEDVKQNRMYDEFAHLWPLISAPEDYAEEARYWREAIREVIGQGRHQILELGVGGGNNLSHLTSEFQATAVDLSEKMLENSRRLNPEVEHLVGDMRSIRLQRVFDAVLIHDAITYLRSEDELRATFATAAAHLRQGGVFITSPDHTTESFRSGVIEHDKSSDRETELTYIEFSYDPDPNDSTYESLMVYLIRDSSGFRIELDRHILGLFPDSTWVQLIEAAGFTVAKRPYVVHPDGHEGFLYVGTRL